MNLNQLRFAMAIAETRSFSQAAERCNVTQPTLSNGIRKLETELGEHLFERTTRKVELTSFGARILPLVKAVLDARAELEKGAAALLNPQQKFLRLGLSPLINLRLLTRVLEPYQRQHRTVECFFKECFLDALEQRLDEGQLDVAFRPVDADQPPKLHHEQCPFYEEQLYFLPRSGKAFEAADRGPVLLEAVAEETFVLTQDGCGLAPATRKLFADNGLELKEYPGQAIEYQVLQEWAELGIGAAIVPESKISPGNRNNARPLITARGVPALMRYEAAWRKRARHAPHVSELHAHFRRAVPRLIDGFAA